MAVLTAVRRWFIPAALGLPLVLALSAQGSTISEAQLKAALIYNFASFVEWPSPLATDQPLVVGVAGDDQVAAAIRALPALPGGRRLDVRLLDEAEDPRQLQIFYLAVNERATAALLARLRNAPVLTVGDHDRFTQLGGMIRLFAERDRMRFEVHLGHASAAHLRISSRVLRLARLVRESDAAKH